jgi:membrane protein
MRTVKERTRRKLDELYLTTERASRGWLSLLHRTWKAYGQHDGPTVARSLAYYALFSFFPLLLALISLGSYVLDSQEVRASVLELVESYLPTSAHLVQRNIEQVLRIRSGISAVALLGLFWSGSGVFRAAYRAVNRAWDSTRLGSIWMQALFALGALLTIGLLLLATVLFSAALSFIRGWQVPLLDWQPFAEAGTGRLWSWLSALLPALISVAVFTLVYRTLPRATVTWRDVLPGGVAAGLVWEAVKQLFTWYVANFARYSLVYGSLGAIIAFLLWAYLSAIILLLGAEFTAQYSQWRRAGRPVENRPPGEWQEVG